ncbi:MAG: hypothetical protein U1A04_02970, partial [Moraxellaceae bacterium]|nr:hypothetical protein [Moraxellaceae bacterium]
KGTQTVTYNGSARQMSVTNSAGLTTTQVFDTQGRLVSINQAATGETTRTTQYVYDAAGRLTLTQDPTGVRNYTFYDEAGRVSARVDGTGAVIEYIYNAAGQLTQQKHYANQVTEATRAAWFNGSTVMPTLVSEIRPATHTDDRTISYAYDSAGRQISSTNGIGTVTTYGYDGSHQLVSVKTGARTTRTFYDAAGRQSGQLDAEGYLRENIYNAAGQLVQVIRYAALTPSAQRASGSLDDLRPDVTGALSTWYFYDNAGRQIGSVDEQGFVTESVFDEATNTRQSIRYAMPYELAISTSTTFGSIQSAVASGAKQSITAVFDSMGRLSSQTQQDGTKIQYAYDTAGRLVKETAASGTTESRALTSRYNAFGEVTGRLLGEASALVVAGMTPAQVAAIYDQYGLTWSYDAAGRQVSVKDAFGNRSVSYYDEAGRLTHVVNALGEVKESLYNAFGEVSERTAITNRLSAANTNSLTGGLLNTTMKSLIVGIKNAANDNKTTYNYDHRGLLTSSVDAMGWLTSSTYSAFGELASLTRRISSSVTVRESYTYNKRGELLTRAEDTAALNRTTSATYDAFGRVTSRTDGRGLITTTTYDLNGRTVTVTDPLNQTRV